MSLTESTIRTRVVAMMAELRSSGAGTFDVTRPDEVITYHKGIYGVQYAKPIPPIRRLLAIDRELLALSTTYADLQPRVIQLAVELIDASDGRLENTVAIVVHKDPRGDSKLKAWGRDVGLTVIPVHMPGDILPKGEDLERRLLVEFFVHDPFNVTGPVSTDAQFYGRRDEAQDLARHLQEGEVRAALGMRKTGKTSLLNRVILELQDYHNCYTVVVDCSRDSIWELGAAALLASIADAVRESTSSDDCLAETRARRHSGTISESYAELIDAIRAADGTVALMFDEVDYITPGSPTSQSWRTEFNPFWRNLRAAYQELARSQTKLSLFISGVSTKWFTAESIDGVENAALAFVPEEYLVPLSPGACITMIKQLGRSSGLLFDDKSAEAIGEACSNIPFWVRKAGSYLHRNVETEARPLNVSADRARLIVNAFVQHEGASISEVALSHLFRVYPELRPVAAASLDGDASPHSWALISTLHRYGVIKLPSSYPEISGIMMAAGLREALARSAVALSTEANIDREQLRFAGVTEWAEELAQVGARRNIVEKRLRNMLIALMRMDGIQNKGRSPLTQRLLKPVTAPRAEKLKAHSPDDLIEKLTWLELTSVIEHEWALMGTLLVDKREFRDQATILNSRPDAHAKDADRADLALQRRALAWFEAALSRG